MIINTVKEYLSSQHGVKDSVQLAKETGLPESTCRWVMNNPKNSVSDRILDVLCERYECEVGDLKKYVSDRIIHCHYCGNDNHQAAGSNPVVECKECGRPLVVP